MITFNNDIIALDKQNYQSLLETISNDLNNIDIYVLAIDKDLRLIINSQHYDYILTPRKLYRSDDKNRTDEITKLFNKTHEKQRFTEKRTIEINKTIFVEFLKENTNSSVDVNKIVDDEYLSSNIKIFWYLYNNGKIQRKIILYQDYNLLLYNGICITHMFEKFERRYKIAQILV